MAPSQIQPEDCNGNYTPMEGIEWLPLKGVKVIMITGGAGFIGSWMTRSLTITYAGFYHIVCFDSVTDCATRNNLKVLEEMPNFIFVKGDITSLDETMDCVREHKVDAIIHFAALSHVDTSFSSPCGFSYTNFIGTHNLLEAARMYGIKRFVHISTDEVYGEVLPGARDHVETDALYPTNPYAASKAAAEMMVAAYIKSFRIPAVVVRSNNVYGPNQFPEKVIPKFAMLLLRNEAVPLYGHGEYTRRYVHASDAVNAITLILHRGTVGEIYNIGTYDEISNRTLCTMLLRFIRPKHGAVETKGNGDLESWIQATPDRPFHDRRYGVDFAKLTKLGWKQKVDFEIGLQETVEWYRAHGDGWWEGVDAALSG